MRKILKPAISGNHSAASGYTSVRTAAGTSPLISRSIALAWPLLNWNSGAPAAMIAARTSASEVDCLSSIAMLLLVRSAIDLISGRTMTRANRRLALSDNAAALLSASPRRAVSAASERSALFASEPGAAARSAVAICCCIVLTFELAAASPARCESATSASGILLEFGAACDVAAAASINMQVSITDLFDITTPFGRGGSRRRLIDGDRTRRKIRNPRGRSNKSAYRPTARMRTPSRLVRKIRRSNPDRKLPDRAPYPERDRQTAR